MRRLVGNLTAFVVAGVGSWAATFGEESQNTAITSGGMNGFGVPANSDPGTSNVVNSTVAEVLMRGPVHEAFGQPVNFNSGPGLTVRSRPPDRINEMAPNLMPDGGNVRWIPGYWGWDSGQNAFVWVTGMWRIPPAGQRWVPGYWATQNRGYIWVRGFWTSVDNRQLTYLPQPPVVRDVLPTTPAPSTGQFWVPGNWAYRNGSFHWQPGAWIRAAGNATWTPATYVWTPQGTLFANGFWDHWPTHRGLMFSPMWFGNSTGAFIPQQVIPVASLLATLFVQPDYSHYLFGNYYHSANIGQGIYPWVNAGQYISGSYDPIRIGYLTGITPGARDQFDRISEWNDFFVTNPSLRSPPTLAQADAAQLAESSTLAKLNAELPLSVPLSRLQTLARGSLNLMPVSNASRRRFREEVRELVNLQTARSRLDLAQAASPGKLAALELPPLNNSAAQLAFLSPALSPLGSRGPGVAGSRPSLHPMSAGLPWGEIPEAPTLEAAGIPLEARRIVPETMPTPMGSSSAGERVPSGTGQAVGPATPAGKR